MSTELKDYYSKWKVIKPSAIILGLFIKNALQHNKAMDGFDYINEKSPQLTDFKFDKENSKLSLRNKEEIADKQIILRLLNYKRLELMWGSDVEFSFHSAIESFSKNIQKGFGIKADNIEFIDLQFHAHSDWPGHHYKAIFDAFWKNTPFASLCKPKNILQDDIYFRGILEEDKICAIAIESNIRDFEIYDESFENDLLKIVIGIAQNLKSPTNEEITTIFEKHAKYCLEFIKNKFIPSIIKPLDEAFIKLSKK